jgi:glycosyltransferase involved in cell wall biosynthesis
MQEDPLVSILIPCFNAEKWLEQTISSALEQSYSNIEVVVLDDGSSDQSVKIAEQFGSKIKLIKQTNQGGDISRQNLLNQASGKWIQYLDADDYLLEDKIANQIEYLKTRPDIEVLLSPICIEYWNGTALVAFEKRTFLSGEDLLEKFARWEWPQTGGPLWDKSCLNRVGGWAQGQKVCQDYELYFRAIKSNVKFDVLDYAGAVYRIWTGDSVCHKDPSATSKERLRLTEELESYLVDAQLLTPNRQHAINQSKFELARTLWNYDTKISEDIIERIGQTEPRFQPEATLLYKIMFQITSFDKIEKLAKTIRQIKSLFRIPFRKRIGSI